MASARALRHTGNTDRFRTLGQMHPPRLSDAPLARRTLLLGAAGLGLAGCTADASAPSSTVTAATTVPASSTTTSLGSPTTTTIPSTTTAPPATSSTTTTPAAAPLPASAVWPLPPNDVEPMPKERAVRLVESLTAWGAGQSGAGPAAARAQAVGLTADVAGAVVAAAASFLGSAPEATSRVISAQFGGLTSDQASILVTYEQWTRDPKGQPVRGGSAADVRLDRRGSTWVVTALNAAAPGAAGSDPSRLMTAILGSQRIHLPPSAAADIAAGNLMPKPMQALLDLAGSFEIDVSIVHSAHPTNVFDTNRVSDHTRKRAVDVWAVNGQPVVATSTPTAIVDGFMRAAVDLGAYNVGGPRQLSGAAYFSDRTHSDHVHLGFNADT